MNSAQRERLKSLLLGLGMPATDGLERILDISSFDEIARETALVRAGDHPDSFWMISKGLVRLVYSLDDGKERNKAFYAEGHLTGPVSAAFAGTPAPFSIETLESCHLFVIPFKQLQALIDHDPDLLRAFFMQMTQAFIRNEQREAVLLNFNAERRFRWLMDHEPKWLDRIQQFHLASYLGIDAVSFSRLKKQLRP